MKSVFKIIQKKDIDSLYYAQLSELISYVSQKRQEVKLFNEEKIYKKIKKIIKVGDIVNAIYFGSSRSRDKYKITKKTKDYLIAKNISSNYNATILYSALTRIYRDNILIFSKTKFMRKNNMLSFFLYNKSKKNKT